MSIISDKLEGWKIYDTKIDYKKLSAENFTWATFDQDAHKYIEPDAKGYVTEPLAKELISDAGLKETCLINIGVGRGKSTAAYEVIKHFYGLPEYIVIVLAPFKKLVERDFQIFKEYPDTVHYEMLGNPKVGDDLLKKAKLHFITINTLLGNPGEDNLEITREKRNYIKQIQQYCREAKKKVVFVFDEIHAGINVFTKEYALNLLGWHDITHKCYLLSATFTESSRIVIDYFSILTDHKLKIYEVARAKFSVQSALHLMMIKGYYNSSDLSIFDPIADIINKAVEEQKRVHIITAYKNLAQELCSDGDFKICKAIQRLDYNLLLGGQSRSSFNHLKSNIGTTFYTGISFEHPEDVLILFLPTSDDNKAGGIFTNGKVAINQAIARLRTDGNIYVVMPQPTVLIAGGEVGYMVNNEVVHRSCVVKPNKEDEQNNLLKQFYTKQKAEIAHALEVAKVITEGNDWEERAPLKYPTFGEFVLEHGDEYLSSRYESYGKGYAPYMLWAAMNNQFENTTLKSLTRIYREVKEVRLSAENLVDDLRNLFDQYKEHIAALPVDAAYSFMLKMMADNNTKLIYIRDEKASEYELKDNTRWPKEIKQEFVNLIFLYKTGIYYVISEENYVRYRMENIDFEDGKVSSLDKIYYQLNWLYWRFFDAGVDQATGEYLTHNGSYIDENAISINLYHISVLIFNSLLSHDILLKRSQAFDTLLRNLPGNKLGEMPSDWMELNYEKINLQADSKENIAPLEKNLRIAIYKVLREIVFETERHSKTKRDKLLGFKKLG